MRTTLLLTALIFSLLLAGCFASMTDNRRGASSSLVDFLYPSGQKPPAVTEEIPVLNLPLRVGLAFVPSNNYSEGLAPATQIQLLDRVKAAFSKEKYISDITVIPDVYLKGGKGFSTIDQVARLHSIDVIALVSYDQVSNLTDTKSSLLYWTIAGAYIIKGNKSDVQTFVDTAVFDIATHKLLFRAPGVDNISSKTTLVDAEDNIRKNKNKSFEAAVDDMNINLAAELARFKDRIKTEKVAKVNYSSGGGGGQTAVWLLVLLAGLYCSASRINPRTT